MQLDRVAFATVYQSSTTTKRSIPRKRATSFTGFPDTYASPEASAWVLHPSVMIPVHRRTRDDAPEHFEREKRIDVYHIDSSPPPPPPPPPHPQLPIAPFTWAQHARVCVALVFVTRNTQPLPTLRSLCTHENLSVIIVSFLKTFALSLFTSSHVKGIYNFDIVHCYRLWLAHTIDKCISSKKHSALHFTSLRVFAKTPRFMNDSYVLMRLVIDFLFK